MSFVRAISRIIFALSLLAASLITVAIVQFKLSAAHHSISDSKWTNPAYGSFSQSGSLWRCNDAAVSSNDVRLMSQSWGRATITLAWASVSARKSTGYNEFLDWPSTILAGLSHGNNPLDFHSTTFRSVIRSVQSGFASDVLTAEVTDLCLIKSSPTSKPQAVVFESAEGSPCCTSLRVLQPFRSDELQVRTQDSALGYWNLRNVNGQALIVVADISFFGRWGAQDDQASPVEVFALANGSFVNVTGEHRKIIQQDAAYWWTVPIGPHSTGDPDNYYAAWMADECRLGQGTQSWARFVRLMGSGKLTAPPAGQVGAIWNHTFLARLRTALHAHGLCRSDALPINKGSA